MEKQTKGNSYNGLSQGPATQEQKLEELKLKIQDIKDTVERNQIKTTLKQMAPASS